MKHFFNLKKETLKDYHYLIIIQHICIIHWWFTNDVYKSKTPSPCLILVICVVDTTKSPTTYRPRRPFWTSSSCCSTAHRSSTPSWATAQSGRTSSRRCWARSPRVASRSSTASSRTTEKSTSPCLPANVWEIPLFGVLFTETCFYMPEEFYRLFLEFIEQDAENIIWLCILLSFSLHKNIKD